MTRKETLLKYRYSLRIFISLLEADKSIKELLADLFKKRLRLKELSTITCSNCKSVNTKDTAVMEEVERSVSSNTSAMLPDFRCVKCRKRLLKKRRGKLITPYHTEIVLELPQKTLRSKSGHLKRNEIK